MKIQKYNKLACHLHNEKEYFVHIRIKSRINPKKNI